VASQPSRARRDVAAIATVPRIRVPSRDEFHAKIVPLSKPVIIEGAFDDWELRSPPLSTGALIDRLAALVGKRQVVVATAQRSNEGLFSYADGEARGQNFIDSRKRFGAFLDELHRDGPALYLRSAPLPEELPELLPQFQLDLVRDHQNSTGTPRLWIGNGGHRVALHYDRDDNVLCVIAGRKRFTLYPPSALPNLYIGGFGLEPGGVATALVDPLHPDYDRFPRFREAQRECIVAELAAGDALYVPAHWWHHVESFDVNVAVTFWWCRTTMEDRLAAEACLVNGLLALRTLPPHLRDVYRILFDSFVFEHHGDPYAHLDEPLQGWAGRPTPERTRLLREKLRQLIDGSKILGPHANVELGHKHALVTGISFRVAQENIEIHGDFEYPIVVPYEVFEILREFGSPISPRRLAKKRYPRSATARRDFERMCHALVVRGVLVDCEVASR
jgi:hypothetical protein